MSFLHKSGKFTYEYGERPKGSNYINYYNVIYNGQHKTSIHMPRLKAASHNWWPVMTGDTYEVRQNPYKSEVIDIIYMDCKLNTHKADRISQTFHVA